jgi:propanediol dehydratase large subunit
MDDDRIRLGRFAALDKRPVNLGGFAQRDDEAGLVREAAAVCARRCLLRTD